MDALGAVAALAADATITFVEPVPEDYQCNICLAAARDAVVTEQCGHLFCNECIVRAMDQRAECPVDRLALTPPQIRKDIRAQRKIQSLRVHCLNLDQGCDWIGELGDLPAHYRHCDCTAAVCPFEPFGCSTRCSRATLDAHLQTAAVVHTLQMAESLTALKAECARLRTANTVYQRMLQLSLDSDYFLWSVPDFTLRQGTEVSKIFKAQGYNWYVKVDFNESSQYSAVYLYASAHTHRVNFEFILFNADPARDEVLYIDDWHPDFKGKGWGNKRFVDRSTLTDAGFTVDGRVTLGVHLIGDPY